MTRRVQLPGLAPRRPRPLDRGRAAHDPQAAAGGERLRLFVALELPAPIVDAARRVGAAARRARACGSSRAESLHVTLAFLGERPDEEADAIAAALRRSRRRSPGLRVGEPAWLPPRRPGVLAVDLDDGDGACARLQTAVSAALAGLGALRPREAPVPARTSPWAASARGARVDTRGAPDLRPPRPSPPPPSPSTVRARAHRAPATTRSRAAPCHDPRILLLALCGLLVAAPAARGVLARRGPALRPAVGRRPRAPRPRRHPRRHAGARPGRPARRRRRGGARRATSRADGRGRRRGGARALRRRPGAARPPAPACRAAATPTASSPTTTTSWTRSRRRTPASSARSSLPKKSIEGRDLVGVEIAGDVNRDDDGRPVAAFFGLHHAREWPSGEVNMEFALDLARGYGERRADHRAARPRARVHRPRRQPRRVRRLARRGRGRAGRRATRCTGATAAPATPEEEDAVPVRAHRNGADLNRNYGAGWGGTGREHVDPTSDSYRGTGPVLRARVAGVHEFSQRHQIMHVQSTHNIVGQVLRQPGFQDYGLFTPDEGDHEGRSATRWATATDYESLLGYDLYDVHGATEDWNYIAQGAMGYTIELGPSDTRGPSPIGGGRAAVLRPVPDARRRPVPRRRHRRPGRPGHPRGVPARRRAGRRTRPTTASSPGRARRPGTRCASARTSRRTTVRLLRRRRTAPDAARLPILEFRDFLESTLPVPATGRFEWHVGPSTRPWLGEAGRRGDVGADVRDAGRRGRSPAARSWSSAASG